MNWMHDAVKIYDAVMAGEISASGNLHLVPICHTEANAHIEITLDATGCFRGARMVSKEEALTILPCTEKSASRAGKQPIPHPLEDKLQYLAADFRAFGGEVTVGYQNDLEQPHKGFMDGLVDWCSSPYADTKAKVVLSYLQRNTLLQDIQRDLGAVLFDGSFFKEGFANKKDYATGAPMDCLVRWRVEVLGDPESKLWRDKSVQNSWCQYYLSTKKEEGLCYVTGQKVPLATLHPARLRHGGDKAKLISANDGIGLTFRGRFVSEQQACGVGFEFSQKAHNALRWLIAKQGRRFGECAYVVWGWDGDEARPPLTPFEDTDLMLGDLFGDVEANQTQLDRAETLAAERRIKLASLYADKLMNCMAGYGSRLGDQHRNIHIVGIDSATPGRMSLVIDRSIDSSKLLVNLESWHSDAAWLQDFGMAGKGKPRRRFVGAPAPVDIAKAAFGEDPQKKLLSSTVNRILPVIIDGAHFPEDLCRACVNRVFRRSGCEPWQWEKALGIACSLYRLTHKERNYQMELEENRESRDYLWGCLLALAEVTERYSLDKQSAEKRPTNAERLFMRFAEQPYATWANIELALQPYLAHLAAGGDMAQGIRRRYKDMSDAIAAKFKTSKLAFTDNSRLSGEFLLGYHCQRHELYAKKDKHQHPPETASEEKEQNDE